MNARVLRTVAVVEDDPACREFFHEELESKGWTVRLFDSIAAFIEAGVEWWRTCDLLLLDLALPGEDAFELLSVWSSLELAPVLVVSSHESDPYVFEALRRGASGYLVKHDALELLGAAAEDTLMGGSVLTPSVAGRVLSHFRALAAGAMSPTFDVAHRECSAPPCPCGGETERASQAKKERPRARSASGEVADSCVEPPTLREREVLHLLGRGLTYGETGDVLGVGIDTVRSHVRSIYRKLHASTKAEAVAIAIRHGWVE